MVLFGLGVVIGLLIAIARKEHILVVKETVKNEVEKVTPQQVQFIDALSPKERFEKSKDLTDFLDRTK